MHYIFSVWSLEMFADLVAGGPSYLIDYINLLISGQAGLEVCLGFF